MGLAGDYLVNAFIGEDKRDWIQDFYKPQSADRRITDLKKVKQSGTKPTLDQGKYTGEYFAKMYGDITVKAENSDLKLHFSHSPKLSATLKHWHHNTWEIVWDMTHAWFDFGLATFSINEKLEVTGLKLNVPNGDIFYHEFDIKKK